MMRPETDRQQMSAFVDGELDLARQLEFESRAESDAQLRDEIEDLKRLAQAVRANGGYHRAPDELRELVRSLGGGAVSSTAPKSSPGPLQRWFAWRPAAVALALAGLLAWGLSLTLRPGAGDEALALEVIGSHVRATLGQRLVDVASSDQHTVKPWLSSRLDFSPPVPALQAQGVVFLGGRVDYVDGRPVAVLVYKRREHVIDVFTWPAGPSDRPVRSLSQRGFNLEHGAHGGMAFWLVSDLNRDELATLARAFEQPGGSP